MKDLPASVVKALHDLTREWFPAFGELAEVGMGDLKDVGLLFWDAALEEAAKIAMDAPLKEDENRNYRWSDTYKTAAWEISHAIRSLKLGAKT